MKFPENLDQPLASFYFDRGEDFLSDSQYTHDGRLLRLGKTTEIKRFGNVYPQVCAEIFECSNCGDGLCSCGKKSPRGMKFGWAHEQGYCTADFIDIFWCKDYTPPIEQATRLHRERFITWLWHDYLEFARPRNCLPEWGGKGNTLNILIRFSEFNGLGFFEMLYP